MKIRIAMLLPALLIIIVVLGFACSKGGLNPMLPGAQDNAEIKTAATDPEAMFVGGLWEVAIDKSTGDVGITQLRGADKAMNVLGFLEPPVLFFLSINLSTLEVDPMTGYVGANVILNHPLYSAADKFDGFDVRGIVFGPRILNADGYTPLLRPKDFKNVPLGYIDGMIGAPDDFTHFDGDNYPYKYFADNLAAKQDLGAFFNNTANLAQRGVFSEGATNVRDYELLFDVDAGQFLIFNYAVLVSYDFPTGSPPHELNDYSINTANCAEPFHVKPAIVHNGLYYDESFGGGGTISIIAEVFDWQGLSDVEVTLESPGVIPAATSSIYTMGSTAKSRIFTFTGVSGTPLSADPVELWIYARDKDVTFGESYFLGLMPSSHALYDVPAYTASKLILNVSDQAAPCVSEVEGDLVAGTGETHEYHVQAESVKYPDGPFTYAWEMGDDNPPIYDDGSGDNAGGIDLTFPQSGNYVVDCKVTDLDGDEGTSISPTTVIVVDKPPAIGPITLAVNRNGDYSIKSQNNVTVDWNPVAGAVEYAVYVDTTPMGGTPNALELAGTTTETLYNYTLEPDGAVYFRISGRALAGVVESEGPRSEEAMVDFEQAEVAGSQGSWEGNSIYDNPEMCMERSSNGAHVLSGSYGWADTISSSSDYYNSYEVFYSQIYPELTNTEVFKLEVVHQVYNYNYSSSSEDGYSMGYLVVSNPIPGLGPDNYLYYVVLNPMSGPSYWPDNDAQRDEFTYSLNPDAGFTYTYWWRLSTFNVDMLQWPHYDRVAIGHATDNATKDGAFLAVDDIAVIIY